MNNLTRNVLAVAIVAPFLAIGAVSGNAEDAPAHPAPVASSDKRISTDPREVLGKLHHSNQKEIEMGKQAKENGQSPEVRNFGDALIKDHTVADEKVAALARKKDIDLTAVTPPKDATSHTVPSGPEFDEHFAEMMIEDHKKEIAEVKSVRDQTSDTDLKELLTELLPTLEKHLSTAEAIEKK